MTELAGLALLCFCAALWCALDASGRDPFHDADDRLAAPVAPQARTPRTPADGVKAALQAWKRERTRRRIGVLYVGERMPPCDAVVSAACPDPRK